MFIDEEFPFLAGLREHWSTIRDEYLALPVDAFDPWVQRDMYSGWCGPRSHGNLEGDPCSANRR
jgi:hypothetical protein